MGSDSFKNGGLCMMRLLILLVTICSFFVSPTHRSANAAIVETAAAGVVVDRLMSDLNSTLDSAVQSGDYLLARAAIEALDVLQSWKEVNADLIGSAFRELDQASRDNFARADALLDNASIAASELLEVGDGISINLAQTVNDLPGNSKTYVLRVSPTVVAQRSGGELEVTIRGVGFDDASPRLMLGDHVAELSQHTQTEVKFLLPFDSLEVAAEGMTRNALSLEYTAPKADFFSRLFGRREDRSRVISVATLPTNLGTYTFSRNEVHQNTENETYTVDLGRFSGRNKRITKVANPKSGWLWDVGQGSGAFEGIQERGEAGRCGTVDWATHSPNGLSFSADVDEIRDSSNLGGLRKKDGYVDCKLRGPIYRVVDVERTAGPFDGSISWFRDIELDVPAQTRSWTLRIDTFDGRSVAASSDLADNFFEVVTTGEKLILRPRIPTGL